VARGREDLGGGLRYAITLFQGWIGLGALFPGRCPGLSHGAPLGRVRGWGGWRRERVPYETLIRLLIAPDAACGHAAGKEREGASARCVFPRGAVRPLAVRARLRRAPRPLPVARSSAAR